MAFKKIINIEKLWKATNNKIKQHGIMDRTYNKPIHSRSQIGNFIKKTK